VSVVDDIKDKFGGSDGSDESLTSSGLTESNGRYSGSEAETGTSGSRGGSLDSRSPVEQKTGQQPNTKRNGQQAGGAADRRQNGTEQRTTRNNQTGRRPPQQNQPQQNQQTGTRGSRETLSRNTRKKMENAGLSEDKGSRLERIEQQNKEMLQILKRIEQSLR
jgi:hypothetical protein